MAESRSFNFFRAGGFDQVRFDSGQDLLDLDKLDQKLWVALACPTKGLAFDSRTLELIDLDKDGRIRAPELIAAVKWAGSLLKNADELLTGLKELPLSSINEATEEGKKILLAAKTILISLGKVSASSISVADMTDAAKAFDAQPHNGDGIVTEDSAATVEAKQLVKEIIDTVGSVLDRSGKPGVNEEKVNQFFAQVTEHVQWLKRSEIDAALLPLKADTAAAFEAFKAVRAKVDDYFTRGKLAAFDERAIAALNREEKEYLAIAAKDLTITCAEIQSFPLAKVSTNSHLPLSLGVNPAWAEMLDTLLAIVIKPLLGVRTSLSEGDWNLIKNKFAAYEAWQAAKAGAVVEKLGPARLMVLAETNSRQPLDELLAKEKEQEPTAQSIILVEKLVRFARDLGRLVNNFVSFREFYERKTPAIFQVGRLFLDQREAQLCIRVEDAAKHSLMAPLSRAYLAYCDVTRPASSEKMTIAAAITARDYDNLLVGSHGIFYDNEGRDWDATITKIVDNPISVRQAFWSPYKKLQRFVEQQVAKRVTEADSASNTMLTAGAKKFETAATTGKTDAPKKFDVGVVAALGVAVGGVTAALGAMLQAIFGLGIWMPLGILGIILLISGPAMLIAWSKLRQRNIGPLLDANGWAVNSNARLNVTFGGSLTCVKTLPLGSHLDKVDPFAEKRRPWGLYLFILLILSIAACWYLGKLDCFLPEIMRQATVFGP